MKVWITKYALTSGITEHEAEPEHADGMISYRFNGMNQYAHGEGKEWHKNFASAKTRAEKMRVDKIASLKKSLAKLEAMSFDA